MLPLRPLGAAHASGRAWWMGPTPHLGLRSLDVKAEGPLQFFAGQPEVFSQVNGLMIVIHIVIKIVIYSDS